MSSSYTVSESTSFSVTHARQLAAKVATDLKRIQRFYGLPTDAQIADYEAELTEFIRGKYLGTVTYGYKRDNAWSEPTLRYTARELDAATGVDDDPGRVRPGANVTGASFGSFLTYSSTWDALTPAEKEQVKRRLPVKRGTGETPGVSGYLTADRSYSAGGRALNRESVRGY